MYEQGDVNAGVIPCSQGIGLAREIKPVAEVISGMVREAQSRLAQVGKSA
jgi:NAD(P)H-dependent flavin oxidoreductase YrpB (nitropropane dioxygenase family)